MRVTKEQIRKMLPGQVLTVPCDNASELDSVYQTALQVKQEDGMLPLVLSRSSKTNTVVIRAEKRD